MLQTISINRLNQLLEELEGYDCEWNTFTRDEELGHVYNVTVVRLNSDTILPILTCRDTLYSTYSASVNELKVDIQAATTKLCEHLLVGGFTLCTCHEYTTSTGTTTMSVTTYVLSLD